MEKRIEKLESRTNKNSQNSNKSSSSDSPFKKPKKKMKKGRRKKEAQKGHKGHKQELLEPTQELNNDSWMVQFVIPTGRLESGSCSVHSENVVNSEEYHFQCGLGLWMERFDAWQGYLDSLSIHTLIY